MQKSLNSSEHTNTSTDRIMHRISRAARIMAVGLLLAGLIVPCALAREGEAEEPAETHYSLTNPQPIDGNIYTGRPGFGTGTSAVPIGRLQVELGYTYTDGPGGHETDSQSVPNTLLRFGVIDTVELRLSTAGYIDREGGEDGFDDFRIGSKIEVMGQDGIIPKLALQPSFKIPMKDASNSDELDPLLQVPASWNLGGGWGMLMNFNIGAVSDEKKDTETVLAHSVLISRALTDRAWVFAEYFAEYPRDSAETQNVDFGGAYLINNNLQIDASVGFGLNDDSNDMFVSTGVSFRF